MKFSGTERYTLDRKIGSGGMGTVYLAIDELKGTTVALKVMHEMTSGNLVAFKREFRTIADLRHPNLVRLFELTDTGEELFYSMEHINGMNLAEIIYGRPNRKNELSAPDTLLSDLTGDTPSNLPLSEIGTVPPAPYEERADRLLATATDIERIYHLLPQILDALEFLHTNDIVHRDLKPDNILVTANNEVKLVDFGIIKDLRPGRMTSRNPDQVVGTIEYMAPEQIHAKEITPRTDLYTLGCVLHEYLTGQMLFSGSAFEVMAQHLNTRPVSVSTINPKVPKELAQICDSLLAKNPSERISIQEIRKVLRLKSETSRSSVSHSNSIFVGRLSERAQMEAQLQRVSNRRMEMSLIEGESGVGKSALAEAMIRYANMMGFQVFRGRCYEREELAYRAFDRIMDEVSISFKHRQVSSETSELDPINALSWIFPSFGILQKGLKPTSWSPYAEYEASEVEADPRIRRAQAFAALKPMVELLTQDKPALFVIDDLHWADDDSIELLEALVESVRRQPLMIIGTFRGNEIDDTHALRKFLKRPDARAVCTMHRLQAMNLTEISNFLIQLFGRPLRPEFVEQVYEQSQGLPLFAKELATYSQGNRPDHPEQNIPSFSRLIVDRLASISENARNLTAVAAIAGGPIDSVLFRKVTGLTPGIFTEALDELLARNILKPVSEQVRRDSFSPPSIGGERRRSVAPEIKASLSYDFYHDWIRREAYELMPIESRKKLHRLFAEHLESEITPSNEALARQWRLAGQQKRAVVHGLKGAENAARHLAFAHAIDSYEALLNEIEKDRLLSDISGLSRSYERLAELYEFTGAYREACQALERAITWLSQDDEYEDTRYRLHIHLAANLVKIGEVEHGTEIFNKLLGRVGLSLSNSFTKSLLSCAWLRFKILVNEWRSNISPSELKLPAPQKTSKLDLYRKVSESFGFVSPLYMAEYQMRFQLEAQGVDLVSAQVHSIALEAIYQALTGGRPKFVQKAHRLLDEAQTYAVEAKVPFVEAYTLGVRGFIDCAIGSWDRARRELSEVIVGFRREHALHRWEVRMCRSWLMLTEHFSGNASSADEIAQDFSTREETDVVQYSLGSWVVVERSLQTGARETANERLEAWSEVIDSDSMTHFRFLYEISRNSVDNVQGRAQAVLERMRKMQSEVKSAGCLLGAWDMALWNQSGLDAALRLSESGKLFAAERKQAVGLAQDILKRAPKFFQCVAHRALALLAHEEGQSKTAAKHLRAALSLSEQAGVPYYRWLCLEAARRIGPFDASLASETLTLQKDYGYRQL